MTTSTSTLHDAEAREVAQRKQPETYAAYITIRDAWINLLTVANQTGDERLAEAERDAFLVVYNLREVLGLNS